jgi:hypothetical protein
MNPIHEIAKRKQRQILSESSHNPIFQPPSQPTTLIQIYRVSFIHRTKNIKSAHSMRKTLDLRPS